MKPLRIDFAEQGWRATKPHWWLLLAVGAGLSLSAFVGIQAMLQRQDLREAQIRQAFVRQPVANAPRMAAIPEPQAHAVNSAVLQLNLPWRELADAVETATPPNVALLALEPDPRTRSMRILAEAPTSDDMVAYIEALKHQPQFTNALLVKHEVNEQDQNRPLRFQVDVKWATRGVPP